MATLKALPGEIQMISGEGQLFYSEAQKFVEELKNYSTASTQYTVISIIGPQSSGKSYLLNSTFGTNFDVLNGSRGRKQTTKGIWIARCRDPCMIIMDIEGSDGRERGEDDTLFERRSALFSLTVSDVLLLNMWFHDIGRVHGASYGLLKLIFEERVKIEAPNTTVIILVRDYDYDETLPDITKKDLEESMNMLWHQVHGTNRNMRDFIQVIVKDFPHKREQNEFAQKSKALEESLCDLAASGTLEQSHCASSFAYSSGRIWDLICNNKILSAADHKLAMSAYVCSEIKNEILCSLDQEMGYGSLISDTSKSVKEFNTELLLFLKRILARYEEETRAFNGNIRKEVRDKLEEQTLQGFKQTFKDKIVRLGCEKLSLAKPKVRGQLLKLAARDRFSLIGVIRPYLAEFYDNFRADVHPYFKKALNKLCEEFVVSLTRIAEEEANKIAEEEANKIAEEQAKRMQLAMSHYSHYVLYKIKDEILDSLDKETGYESLMSSTTVKAFNRELQLYITRILARFEEETRGHDGNIKEILRDKLEEQTLRRFKPAFEDKIFSLSNEILSSAKSKIRGQLRKLPVLNKESVIGVLRPYVTEFDDNSRTNVHPYFREVLSKHRQELVECLTRIGEKKGNKIMIALRAAGVAWTFVKLVIGTTWAVCMGDVSGAAMMYMNAIGGGGGGVRNIGYRVGGVSTQALLNS